MSWYVLVYGAHMYIPVCTGIYLSVLVHTSTSMYLYIPVHTCMYWYVSVHTSMYWYVLVCTSTYSYVLLCTGIFHSFLQCYSLSDGLWCVQDTIIVVPPFPYSIAEEIDDVPFDDCWYARAQLFFQCHLRPTGGRPPKNPSYKIGPDDLLINLVFFSTFEELILPIHGPMEDAGVLKLYEPGPIPCLDVAPVDHVVGRVPLIPLFLAGNSTPTIPHKFSKHMVQDFPWAVQTRQLLMAGVAATCTRSTLGCGTLAVESLAWVV